MLVSSRERLHHSSSRFAITPISGEAPSPTTKIALAWFQFLIARENVFGVDPAGKKFGDASLTSSAVRALESNVTTT